MSSHHNFGLDPSLPWVTHQWMHTLKVSAYQLINVLSHILFLTVLMGNHAVTPGLRVHIPSTGMPNYMHAHAHAACDTYSRHLQALVLTQYELQVPVLRNKLVSLHRLLTLSVPEVVLRPCLEIGESGETWPTFSADFLKCVFLLYQKPNFNFKDTWWKPHHLSTIPQNLSVGKQRVLFLGANKKWAVPPHGSWDTRTRVGDTWTGALGEMDLHYFGAHKCDVINM